MMHIEGKAKGEPVRPLEELAVTGADGGIVSARDSLGREYFRASGAPTLRYPVGGALGYHTLTYTPGDGGEPQTLRYRVSAETAIRDEDGEFAELLQLLYATMLAFNEVGMTRWNGRVYRFFVSWLRDHVHTMKGMKYFYPELKSAIDLYRDSQREDGMIWDNVQPRGPEPNGWDMRFSYGGFIRPFEDYTGEFKRIPVENDVEYLFVEGLYYTWKAVGDDAWMADTLDAAIKAMEYSVSSPYRWSEKYGLLKRGFTIDTWDFQNAEDEKHSAGGDPTSLAFGDPMAIRPGHTRFGVMHGDNTGYCAACGYLAEMLEHAGRTGEAARYRQRGEEMKRRLDQLSWNGRHYKHHVPEDPALKRDLGVDLDSQVSLSNAYSLNRGLTQEQCAAIIRTYQEIRDHLPAGSPGEWYTIYPPFERGYGGHNAKWQYMNAGVTPIVGGELAHGAFEHGFEAYGADILRRLLAIARAHRGHLHCTLTGSIPPAPARAFTPLDIAAQANTDFAGEGAPGVPGWTGEGPNDLCEMPTGAQRLADIDFLVPDPATNGRRGCIGLGNRPGYTQRAEVPVGREAASAYLLHVSSQLASAVAGTVTFEYSDGTSALIEVVRGKHVGGWWMPEPLDASCTAVAWRGKNAISANVGVLACGLNNPHPEKRIERIVLDGPRADGLWLVLGLSLCDAPVWFPPRTVSYGIPDNWGAAAVVYALIEGLAGVKDEGVAYDRALLAPRWSAAGVDRAEATITYPASEGYVAYRYAYDSTANQLALTVTGSGDACRFHLLLPSDMAPVTSVTADGQPVDFTTSQVEQSRYVDFTLDVARPREVRVASKNQKAEGRRQ